MVKYSKSVISLYAFEGKFCVLLQILFLLYLYFVSFILFIITFEELWGNLAWQIPKEPGMDRGAWQAIVHRVARVGHN